MMLDGIVYVTKNALALLWDKTGKCPAVIDVTYCGRKPVMYDE